MFTFCYDAFVFNAFRRVGRYRDRLPGLDFADI
jgi:hypothetical protein